MHHPGDLLLVFPGERREWLIDQYILQLRWKKDHEVFDTIYESADQGMMGDIVDGIKEFTNLHLERR